MHKCWIASRLLFVWELPTGFWRSEPRCPLRRTTTTGALAPDRSHQHRILAERSWAQCGPSPGKTSAADDWAAPRVGAPSPVARAPTRDRAQSEPLNATAALSGEGGFFGLLNDRRRAAAHPATLRAGRSCSPTKGSPNSHKKQVATEPKRGECQPSRTAGAAPTRMGTT